MTTHSYEIIALEASLPYALRDGGLRVVTLDLGPGDRAWNPTHSERLLRGPVRLSYVLWADGGWDCVEHAAVST